MSEKTFKSVKEFAKHFFPKSLGVSVPSLFDPNACRSLLSKAPKESGDA